MQESVKEEPQGSTLEFKKVESSNVDSVAYDGKDLYVAFLNKSLYKYSDVPVTHYEALLGAGSVGKFLNKSIKGVFSYEKVDYNMLKGEANVTTTVSKNSSTN